MKPHRDQDHAHPVFPQMGWSCHLCRREFAYIFTKCPWCFDYAGEKAAKLQADLAKKAENGPVR